MTNLVLLSHPSARPLITHVTWHLIFIQHFASRLTQVKYLTCLFYISHSFRWNDNLLSHWEEVCVYFLLIMSTYDAEGNEWRHEIRYVVMKRGDTVVVFSSLFPIGDDLSLEIRMREIQRDDWKKKEKEIEKGSLILFLYYEIQKYDWKSQKYLRLIFCYWLLITIFKSSFEYIMIRNIYEKKGKEGKWKVIWFWGEVR